MGSAKDGKLDNYLDKRDFSRTGEPRSGGTRRGHGFVIQKHDASSLHYDLRLEIDGVLVSWAVPKGPSTDPSDKRLAIQTEDHPLDYGNFEGCIPEGEYGAGTVLLWERGSYRNLRSGRDGKPVTMKSSLQDGLIEVWLEGEKLHGGYALKRTRGGKKPQWLLIKMDDEGADARRNPVSTEPDSVKSGRNLAQIASEEGDQDD